jgi:hypothetical protein
MVGAFREIGGVDVDPASDAARAMVEPEEFVRVARLIESELVYRPWLSGDDVQACRAPKSGASSRGDPLVVVDEPAEDVAPTNARAYGPFRRRREIRRIEIESPMRSRSVVVIHVRSEDAL